MSAYIVEYPHTFVHLQGPGKNSHGIICPIDVSFLGFMTYSLSAIQTPCGILVNDFVNQVFTAVLTLLKKRDCLNLRIWVIWQLLFRNFVSFSCPTLTMGGAELAQCYSKPLHLPLCCRRAIENYCGNWCCTTAIAQDGENFLVEKSTASEAKVTKLLQTAAIAPNQRMGCIRPRCTEDSRSYPVFLVLYLCLWGSWVVNSSVFEEAEQESPFFGPACCAWFTHFLCAAAKSLQSYPTLCDCIDGSPSGSPAPGSLQANTLEWVAISFSNAWKWKVKVKSLSRVRLLATPWTVVYQAPPSMGFSRQEYWSGLPFPSPHLLSSPS